MRNTGTWDSDLLFIFTLCFFSPLVLFFLVGLLIKIKEALEPYHTQSFLYVPVEKEVIKVNNVYHYEKSSRSDPVAKKQQRRPKQKPKQKPRHRPSELTNPSIQSDAIVGLVNIGHSKTEARRLVQQLCKSKTYKSSEDIIVDSMSFVV